jgi:hypothetical protein
MAEKPLKVPDIQHGTFEDTKPTLSDFIASH